MENLPGQMLRWGLFGLLLLCVDSQAAPPTAKEYQIKAAFLYNFTNFISWPDSAFPEADTPFRICVLGEDPFGPILDVTTENAIAKNGRALRVERLDAPASAGGVCHILFIGDSERANLGAILQAVRRQATLTVSEADNFMRECGMVRFFTQNNKIRLEINPAALERAGLKADANLLELSKLYDQPECQ